MGTYLIHLDRPLAHASHYVGFSNNILRRLLEHRSGVGSPLLRACNDYGISWRVVRVWADGRGRERAIKRQKNSPRFCPVCNPR